MKTENRSYARLARIRNRFSVKSIETANTAGVRIAKDGNGKATTAEILLPGRCRDGRFRTVAVTLNGRQLRAFARALAAFYNE